jgi:hypothetical protein
VALLTTTNFWLSRYNMSAIASVIALVAASLFLWAGYNMTAEDDFESIAVGLKHLAEGEQPIVEYTNLPCLRFLGLVG